MFKKGDFVTINNKIGIVVMTGEQLPGEMKDHTAVWFGAFEKEVPEVLTIPTDYLATGPEPMMKH